MKSKLLVLFVMVAAISMSAYAQGRHQGGPRMGNGVHMGYGQGMDYGRHMRQWHGMGKWEMAKWASPVSAA